MQDVPRDSSRLPGQRSGSCVRAGQSRQFQALCWEYTDPTGRVHKLARSSRLLPCRRIDGVYHQRTVTPAERTEDFRPTSYRRAQSQHVLIIAEKTCWLTNALSVVGWCIPTPLTGEKVPKSGTRPEPAQIGDSRVRSKRCILSHPVKMAQKNSAGGDCITPTLSCQGSIAPI